jgi:hypothetical protein
LVPSQHKQHNATHSLLTYLNWKTKKHKVLGFLHTKRSWRDLFFFFLGQRNGKRS